MTDCVLHLIDVIADMAQRRVGLGERQQVVKTDGLARRLGDMFRDERALVALNEGAEAREMRLVQGLRSADRHAHAVQRNGMVAANSLEGAMRRAAGAHVVLGVNLKEAARLRPLEDRLQVLGLEACPRQSGNRMRRKAGRRGFPAQNMRSGLSWLSLFPGARVHVARWLT